SWYPDAGSYPSESNPYGPTISHQRDCAGRLPCPKTDDEFDEWQPRKSAHLRAPVFRRRSESTPPILESCSRDASTADDSPFRCLSFPRYTKTRARQRMPSTKRKTTPPLLQHETTP